MIENLHLIAIGVFTRRVCRGWRDDGIIDVGGDIFSDRANRFPARAIVVSLDGRSFLFVVGSRAGVIHPI